jgi:hypothetical protein
MFNVLPITKHKVEVCPKEDLSKLKKPLPVCVKVSNK